MRRSHGRKATGARSADSTEYAAAPCHDDAVRVIVGALVIVLASACSVGGGDPEGDASPESSTGATQKTTPAAPEKPPRRRLRAAQRALSQATGGAYELTVYGQGLDHPLIQERGRFDVPHEVYDIVRTIQNVGAEESEPSSYVIRVRASAGTRFMQMDDWGVWDGCWLEFGNATLAELIGVDLPTFPEIPVPVSLVMDSRLQNRNQPVVHHPSNGAGVVTVADAAPAPEDLDIVTDGFTALQTLGVSGSKLFELDPRAERMMVPVSVSFFYNHPDVAQKLRIEGRDVLRAARAADVDLDESLRTLLPSMLGVVVFSEAPTPVERYEPPAELLIPPTTTGQQPCPANQP
jgi:hypothetical protein